MRILFLSDFYPPVMGGLELQVQALARRLCERGHQVSVATLTLDAPAVSQDEGVTVHHLRGWSRILAPVYQQRVRPFHPTLPDPGVVAALRRIVQAERPQVVSAHSWIVYSFLPLKRSSGARLILRLHDYGLVCPKKTFVCRGVVCSGPGYGKCLRCATAQYGMVEAIGLTTGLNLTNPCVRRAVDLFVANSDAVADAVYLGTGRPRSDVAVVPPWLSDNAFGSPELPRPAFLPPDGDFLMFAGGLGRDKGLDVLLEAYAKLTTRVPLILVGTSREDTPTRLPEGARLVYDVAHEDVLAAWPHCTIALLPSLTEAFGLAAVEAMAAGRPVVASAVGGLKDVIDDGETGLLVPPGDPIALRDAVARLLDNTLERDQMGALAKRQAARYSMSRVLPHIEGLFEGLPMREQTDGR
jgi:glycosyltransferase involved in cell wall biosynthesis